MRLTIIFIFLSNVLYAQTMFKVHSKSDTVTIGDDYSCDFIIDTNYIKDLQNIQIVFLGHKIPRHNEKFTFTIKTYMLGPTKYDFEIIHKSYDKVDTIKYSKIVTVKRKTIPDDFVVFADKMPTFNDNKFNDFDSYFSYKIAETGFITKGKVILVFIVLRSGQTRIERIGPNSLDDKVKSAITKIITESKWLPGQVKDKKVNVQITKVYDF